MDEIAIINKTELDNWSKTRQIKIAIIGAWARSKIEFRLSLIFILKYLFDSQYNCLNEDVSDLGFFNS